MPMDPFSFWIQASVFWARVFKQQHEAYLQMLGAVAEKVPHPTAAQLAAEAQAHAAPSSIATKRPTVKKPVAAQVKAKQPEPAMV